MFSLCRNTTKFRSKRKILGSHHSLFQNEISPLMRKCSPIFSRTPSRFTKRFSSSSGSHHSTPSNAAAVHPSGMINPNGPSVGSHASLAAELLAVIRRYFLLIKGKMTAKRYFSLQSSNSPSAGYNEYTYTFSDLAGHGSFIFLALSYLENDFLNLRMYAVSGITLSILFQYYREKPLWIPIRWNSIFLLINAVMIGFLWKESTDAKNLPDDQRYLYKKLFYPRGMSPVEFMHLMSIAKKKELKADVRLVDERKQNTRVFLVVKGKLSVNKKGNQVGTINENQFVGAMSFLTWQTKVMELRQKQRDAQEQQSFWGNQPQTAVENPVSLGGSAVTNVSSIVTPWNNEENIQSRIMNLFRERKKDIDNDDIALLEDSIAVKSADSQSKQQGQQGYADVISEEDCVVYYWKFNDLIHLLDEHPSLGLVFERCISDDLNRKMTSSWEEEIKTRYRQLLTGAISDGEIKDQTKAMLEKFRSTYSISAIDHERMLKDLDWTSDDFTAGFKGAPKLELISNYEILLKKELEGDFGLTEDARETLREFRQKNGITSEIHLQCLRKHGWTLDDFEVGAKDSEIIKKRKKLLNNEQLTAISSAVAKAIFAQNENIITKQAELAVQQATLKKELESAQNLNSTNQLEYHKSSLSQNNMLHNRPVLRWLSSWFYSTEHDILTESPQRFRRSSYQANVPIVEDLDDTASVAAEMIEKESI